jgi:hypothetical protein
MAKRSLQERLQGKYQINNISGCWLWLGAKRNGYGIIRYYGKLIYAHRASYESAYGAIPDGAIVCHKCDEPLCINPGHFFIGSPADNVADRVSKGRTTKLAGQGHHLSKVGDDDVRQIRKLLADGHMQREVAKMYGISEAMISGIKTRKRWKHVL